MFRVQGLGLSKKYPRQSLGPRVQGLGFLLISLLKKQMVLSICWSLGDHLGMSQNRVNPVLPQQEPPKKGCPYFRKPPSRPETHVGRTRFSRKWRSLHRPAASKDMGTIWGSWLELEVQRRAGVEGLGFRLGGLRLKHVEAQLFGHPADEEGERERHRKLTTRSTYGPPP